MEISDLSHFSVFVKAGLKMKRYQVKVAGLIVLCCLNATSLSFAEEAHDKGKPSKDAAGSRPSAESASITDSFKSVIDSLDSKKDGTIVFKTEKDKESEQITLSSEDIKALHKNFESVKTYAEKMKECSDKDGKDKVSPEVVKTLNEFVDYLSGEKVLAEASKQIEAKKVNTFVVRIQTALAAKHEKFSSTKNEFEKTDKTVQESLVSIAKLLGKGWDKTFVDKEEIEADSAVKAIKSADADIKMCKLDETAATQDSVADQPAPPVASPINPSLGGGFAAQPQVVPTNPAAGGFENNQLRDALDALRRASDTQDRERELQDQFLQQQLAERDRGNEQALRALQGALNQAQRPNVSRGNSDRSEQGPQLSPSVSVPQSPLQQYPQMPMQQMPMQQMPYGMMNQPTPQPIMPYTPSRFNDDIAPRPAVQQPDPTTSALLQTMQQQNQMFQQMMMSRYPYMGNGVQNVNGAGTVGQALQNFGSLRYSRGTGAVGGPRLLPSRFNGNARGGVQGQMSMNPSARGPVPTRLSR